MKMFRWLLLPLVLVVLTVAGCASEAGDKTPPAPVTVQQKVVVYRIPVSGEEMLVPEQQQVTVVAKADLPLAALQCLVNTKPRDSKLENLFPAGTKVLGLQIKDGLASANFSKDLQRRGQGSYEELMFVNAIVNTLTEFPEIKQVQILVEGQKVITLSGHLDVGDPLTRNQTLIKK
ncbi:MAG: GerMN domain-containing protein [Acidaminococcaceae bacterium]